VYAVSKQELPAENVNVLLELQRKNGLHVKYKNLSWDTVDGIQKEISKVLTQNLVSEIKSSPTFAIMLDESTDISVQKRLSICIRYEIKGKPVSKFLLNCYIPDGKSYTIVNCIADEFQKLGISLSKCTSVATDGAAVMMGKKTGVGVQLKAKYAPFATLTHCVAHRLNLACCDSIKKDDYLTKFKLKFNDLYYFISSSANRKTALHDIQEVLEEPGLSIKEPHSVRWMGLKNAVNAVFQCYGAVLATLSSFAADNNPVAKNLYKYFSNYKTALVTALMLDIHIELAKLSCVFQKADLVFSEVQACIDGTVSKLEQLSSTDGPSLTAMKNRIQIDEGVAKFNGNDKLAYRDSMAKEFDNLREQYIERLKKNIRNRLRKEDGDMFADLATVLEPETVLNKSKENRVESVANLGQFFGHEKEVVVIEGNIDNLVENKQVIPALLDPDELDSEWPRLEGMICGAYRGYTTQTLCKQIILHHSTLLPNFAILASIALVMTVSSVECERSFSAQNRLKVKYRSSLSAQKLDTLLKISMLGPDLSHFDPAPAVARWLAAKKRRKRRLCEEYRPRKKAKSTT